MLVKQAERLGNIVLLNSAISALKNRFSEIEIDLLLPAKFSDIMLDDGRINSVIPVYKKRYISRPWELLRLLKKLRKRRYDIAIDCSDVNSRSSTGAAYALLSGAVATAGWQIGNLFDLKVSRYHDIVHASEMYIRLLTGIFGEEFEGDPYFEPVSPGSFDEKPLVGINCGGRDDKRWPLGNFIRLGEILSQKNIPAEYILGPDEEEQRKILQQNMPPRCTLLPLIPVARLKDTFRKYSVFVSSDSGPMHVAWSLDIPVIAIFLSSEMEKFRPLSAGSVSADGGGGLEPQKVFDMVLTALNSRRIMA
ncbi:MAG: glycosyltransferase family 9 protein [Candidatus Zixiibacteriota bacterium]|nr:MAG: glycosyltransferase family 9 protein [candidate division Zixibacteria bacterium]